jgi:hypothetical protein
MIVTLIRLTTTSRRDFAVLQKESSALEGEEDVNVAFRGISAGCQRDSSIARVRDGSSGARGVA